MFLYITSELSILNHKTLICSKHFIWNVPVKMDYEKDVNTHQMNLNNKNIKTPKDLLAFRCIKLFHYFRK